MIRLGHTFGSWMIQVASTNEKLRDRAVRIIAEASGSDVASAVHAYRASGFDTSAAILMLRTGADAERAAALLASNGGRLREALAQWDNPGLAQG
jgi:N-acetylmuramic acid 6-phosphate etherase